MPNSNTRARTPEHHAIPEAARDVKTQPQVRMTEERVSTPELVDERYDNMPCTD
ncbi:MAG: hypothetical protein ACRELY_32310 [Polyangiaceae bacterium]